MQQKNYRISINDGIKEFKLNSEDWNELDVIVTGEGEFHILYQQRSYRAQLIEADYEQKVLQLKINGSLFTIQIADEYDLLIEKLGLHKATIPLVKYIKAPMPGMVLDVAVEKGQPVAQGEQLLILEAMKMENIIKSPRDGTVKTIMAAKGTAVEKGAVLIEME